MMILVFAVLTFLPFGADACGTTFTGSTGMITSPGFPGAYPSNQNCVWIISRPAGERITLTFLQFDLEDDDDCQYDSLLITDGSSATGPRLRRFCGSDLPKPERSFQNSIRIHFRSDDSVSRTGFKISYLASSNLRDEFFFVAVPNAIILVDIETVSNIRVPGLATQKPMAVDFDPVERRIFWTDYTYRHIASANLDGSDGKIVRTLNSVAVPDGIAVDPLSRLVFYTDTGNDVIAMMTMSGSLHRTVVSTDLAQPHAIVLDTMNGVVFWTDRGDGKIPKIERANYDGTDRRTLHSTSLKNPNGLAVDLDNHRLYWVDSGTDMVEYSDLDGNGRTEISATSGRHLYGLAYHDNHLYVTDWTDAGEGTDKSYIYKLNTDGTDEDSVGSAGFRMDDLHIYVEDSWEQGPNACQRNNSACSHLCIPSPGEWFKCICPDAPTNCVTTTTSSTATTPTTTTTTTTSATTTSTTTTTPSTTSTVSSPTTTTTSGTPGPTLVTMAGPQLFDTDGSKEMTLTCDPDDSRVVKSITWSVRCDRQEGRKCVWRPRPPKDDGKVVTCSVSYGDSQSAIGYFKVMLNYPPPRAPAIHGYKTGDLLEADKRITLTCLVRGGKPLVNSVIFFCPGHPDSRMDIRGDSEVQSFLLIDPVTMEDNGKSCVCTAQWKHGEMYTLSVTRILNVTEPKRGTSGISGGGPSGAVIGGAVAGVIVLIAVAVVIVVVIVIVRRRGREKYESRGLQTRRQSEGNPYSTLHSQARRRNSLTRQDSAGSGVYDEVRKSAMYAGGETKYLEPTKPPAEPPSTIYDPKRADYAVKATKGPDNEWNLSKC